MKQYNILGGVDDVEFDNESGMCKRVLKTDDKCEICESQCSSSVCEDCIEIWDEMVFGWLRPSEEIQLNLFEN